MSANIQFPAQVISVRTLADGGIRVTLDLPETAIPQMAMLAECQRQGIYLVFMAQAGIETETENRKESGNAARRKR